MLKFELELINYSFNFKMGGWKLIKEWNLMNAQPHGGNNEVPKVADFLGVGGKSTADQNDESEFVPYNNDYLFTNNSLVLPVQHNASALAVAPTSYDELQENTGNSNTMQSLTLSMGSGKGGNSSTTCETTNSSNANTTTTTTSIVEATPRRTLDTFGQRTSIYRGVTRWAYLFIFFFFYES